KTDIGLAPCDAFHIRNQRWFPKDRIGSWFISVFYFKRLFVSIPTTALGRRTWMAVESEFNDMVFASIAKSG
ncbi:MAG: hypothetical protein ABIK68_12410, partial [bacterium]